MSILIKGMEMPTNCCQCPVNMEVCKRGYEYLLKHPELYDKRADDCPIISIPPHGRLIDVKSLENMHFAESMYDAESKLFVPFVEVASAIFDAPTIIEAEGEK